MLTCEKNRTMGNRTFCAHPMRLSDFRALPTGGNSFRILLLDAKGLALLYDIQEQLRRLAPTGGNGRRSLWIEAVRGDPDEWADYDALRANGEVDGPDDYLALWLDECPDPVAWFEVSVFCSRDRHSLLVSDGENAFWHFSNAGSSPDAETEVRLDVSDFLRPLSRAVGRLVDRICRAPDAYARYMARHFPYSKRYGTIVRKELWRICPEFIPALSDEEVRTLSEVAGAGNPLPEGLPAMTLSAYRRAWMLAASALALPEADEIDVGDTLPAVDGGEEAFLAWADSHSWDHGFDLVYGRLSLRPVRREDGRWHYAVVFPYENSLEDAVHVFHTLRTAGFPVRLQGLDTILEILSGEDRIEIRPGWALSCLGAPEMTLPQPFDAESREQVGRLIAAADWVPLPEVRPDPLQGLF